MSGVSYLNQPVSLISKSSIRYEGILYSINPQEATITLSNVRSYGTEDRKVEKYLAPKETLYEYIVFKANDINELVIDEPHNDPAIVTQMPSSTTSNASAFTAGTLASNENQSNLQSNGLIGAQSTLNGSNQANVPGVSSAGQSNDRSYRSRGPTPTSSQTRSPVSELSSSNRQKTDLNKLMSRSDASGNSASNNNNHPNRNSNYNNNNQRRNWDNNRVNNSYQNTNRNHFNNNRNYNNNMSRRPGSYQNNYSNNNNFNRPGGFRRNDDRLSNNNRNGFRHNGQNNFNGRVMMRNNTNRKFAPVSNKKFDATLKTEFDFEKANQVFQQMVDKLEDLNISVNGADKGEKSGSEDKDKDETTPTTTKTDLDRAADKVAEDDVNFYDKTKSFFDNISCEAIERTKGNQKRFDWKQERKINAETFGLKITYRRNDGNNFRRPFLNRNNPNRRFNNNNNNVNQQPLRNAQRTNSS